MRNSTNIAHSIPDVEISALTTTLATPTPAAFPQYPDSWYYVCTSKSLRPKQVMTVQLCGNKLVIFRSEQGMVTALNARCPHLGSDLSLGRVVGDAIECPYHRFRFDGTGGCDEHNLSARTYPTEERYGAVFVFLGTKQPLFPLPSFPDGIDLISAEPAYIELKTQWYMVCANGFDARHFSHVHDRQLISSPNLSSSDRFSLCIDYKYKIVGTTLIDRVTRFISGAIVDFQVSAWGGNMVLVRARFAKDQSFGLVIVEPQHNQTGDASQDNSPGSRLTVIISAARRGTSLWARFLDNLTVRIKRFAIGQFLMNDAKGLAQLDYVHDGLCAGDETLAAYLRWVADLPQGIEVPVEFYKNERIKS